MGLSFSASRDPLGLDLPEFGTDAGVERFLDLPQQQIAALIRAGLNIDLVMNPFQMHRLGDAPTTIFDLDDAARDADADAREHGSDSDDDDDTVKVRYAAHANTPAHVVPSSLIIRAHPPALVATTTGAAAAAPGGLTSPGAGGVASAPPQPLPVPDMDGWQFSLSFRYSAAVPCAATLVVCALEAPHPRTGAPTFATAPVPQLHAASVPGSNNSYNNSYSSSSAGYGATSPASESANRRRPAGAGAAGAGTGAQGTHGHVYGPFDAQLAALPRPLMVALPAGVGLTATVPLPPLAVVALLAAAGAGADAAAALCPSPGPGYANHAQSAAAAAALPWSPAVAAFLARVAPTPAPAAHGGGGGGGGGGRAGSSAAAAQGPPPGAASGSGGGIAHVALRLCPLAPLPGAHVDAQPPLYRPGASAADPSERGWAECEITTLNLALASAGPGSNAATRGGAGAGASNSSGGATSVESMRSARAAMFATQMRANNERLLSSAGLGSPAPGAAGNSGAGTGDRNFGSAGANPAAAGAAAAAGAGAAAVSASGYGATGAPTAGASLALLAARLAPGTARQTVIAQTGVFELLDIFGLTPPSSSSSAASTHDSSAPAVGAAASGGREVAQPADPAAAAAAAAQEAARASAEAAASVADCVICLSGPAEAVLVPCRHFALCAQCAAALVQQRAEGQVKCPMCRNRVTEVVVA